MFQRRDPYGRGYRCARTGAFRRSGGICQLCGRRPAQEAHHWALRYPDDDAVTAADLTALCRTCHWMATFLRLLDRTRVARVWLVLTGGSQPASHRAGIARRKVRGCGAPAGPATTLPAPVDPGLELRLLEERCRLRLVVGCLRCRRFVPLDGVAYFRRHGWTSMAVAQLRRRLCCCRCRTRTRWVLLACWPPAGAGASAGRGPAPRCGRR